MKGIKAKKTNTPPFIKEEIDKLITYLDTTITEESQIEEAKENMKKRVTTLVKKVLDGKIPLEKMVIFQKLSKNLDDYGKPPILYFNRALTGLLHEKIPHSFQALIDLIKVRYKHKAGLTNTSEESDKNVSNMVKTNLNLNFADNTKTEEMIERIRSNKKELRKWIYNHFQIKGFPQASRCALMIAQTGEEVRKGDFITYLKVNDKDKGAYPSDLLRNANELDADTYIGEIDSSFSQIYDCFGLDTEAIIDQARTGKKVIPLTAFMKPKSKSSGSSKKKDVTSEVPIETDPKKPPEKIEGFEKTIIQYQEQSMSELLDIVKENINRGIPFTIKFTNNPVKLMEFKEILESHKDVLNLLYVKVINEVNNEKPKKKTGLDMFNKKK